MYGMHPMLYHVSIKRRHTTTLNRNRTCCLSIFILHHIWANIHSSQHLTLLQMAELISSALATYGSTEGDHHRSLEINDGIEASFFLEQKADASHDDGSSIHKYWFFLFITIVLEVLGTTSMKLSDGLTKVLPTIMIYIAYGLSFTVFPLALKRIDLSTAYAIWSGGKYGSFCVVSLCIMGYKNFRSLFLFYSGNYVDLCYWVCILWW